MSWRMKRIVATSLLLYALVDLTVPGLCHGDDAIPLPPVSSGVTQEQAANPDGNVPASSPTRDQDDCFCCCWHILLTVASRVVEIINVALASTVSVPTYFRLFADPFFHPPRA